MNRRTLQTLARDRLADARALLRAHRYAAAYYMAGYAVECALKACITKHVNRHDFPDKKLATDSYTHDLNRLVTAATSGMVSTQRVRPMKFLKRIGASCATGRHDLDQG